MSFQSLSTGPLYNKVGTQDMGRKCTDCLEVCSEMNAWRYHISAWELRQHAALLLSQYALPLVHCFAPDNGRLILAVPLLSCRFNHLSLEPRLPSSEDLDSLSGTEAESQLGSSLDCRL